MLSAHTNINNSLIPASLPLPKLLTNTTAPPLLHFVLPELEALSKQVESAELLVVPCHVYDIPRVAGGSLKIRLGSNHGFVE